MIICSWWVNNFCVTQSSGNVDVTKQESEIWEQNVITSGKTNDCFPCKISVRRREFSSFMMFVMHKDGWKVPNICKKLVVLDRQSVYFHFSYKLNSTTFTSTANTSRQYHFYLFQVPLPGYILMTKLVSFNFLQTIERQPSCANKEKNKRMKKTFIFRTGGVRK